MDVVNPPSPFLWPATEAVDPRCSPISAGSHPARVGCVSSFLFFLRRLKSFFIVAQLRHFLSSAIEESLAFSLENAW